MVHSLLLGILLTLCVIDRVQAQARPDSLAVVDEIGRLEHQWASALVQQDTVVIHRLLAPEYGLIVSASPQRPISRAAWLATLPDYHTRSFAIGELTVRVLGDVAMASFVGDLVARVRGAERSGKYFITDVWRRRDGAWRVIARYSSRPEEASSSTRALERTAGDSALKR